MGIAEVFSRRRLIAYLVRADVKKHGADTLLGNVWWVMDPLLQMLVYVVMVGLIFRSSTPDYPLFVFAAILPWKWFQAAVQDGSTSVLSMGQVIKQVNFPKLVLPFASVTAGIVNFGFGMIPLAGLVGIFYADRASAWVLLIPVIAVVQYVFSLALTTFLAAVNVFYRDIGNVSRHFLRFWFYLSPGLYSIDRIDSVREKFPPAGIVMDLNPWATLFTAYRDVIYDKRAPNLEGLVILLVVSLVLLAGSILFFKRVEPTFAKVL
jgi:ABC-type polysaccharide/polyol phosphate export permease